MKTRLALVLALFTSGCAHTSRVAPHEADVRATINERAAQQRAVVRLHDGLEHPAEALRLDADSTSWQEPETGQFRSVATQSVSSISFAPKRRIGEGIMLGLMGGLVAGGVIGFVAPGSSDEFLNGREDRAAFGTMFGGLAGALVGGLVSADSEQRDVFVLVPSLEGTD